MKTKLHIKLVRRTVTAEGMPPDEADAFKKLVASGSLETTEAVVDGHTLPAKQTKELRALCAFAQAHEFQGFVKAHAGCEPPDEFDVEILGDGEDPPDALLKIGGRTFSIEVTDFPPNQAPLLKAIAATPGPSRWPTLHEAGRNPRDIKAFMAMPVSLVQPHFSSVAKEAESLLRAAEDVVRKKDEARCSDVLLLHGPAAFSFPEEEVIDAVVRTRPFVSLKAVVFVRAHGCRIWPTNMASE